MAKELCEGDAKVVMLEAGKDVRPSDLLSHKWPYELRFANLRGEKTGLLLSAAQAAQVSLFADRTVSADAQKSDWRKGLHLFREEAEKFFFSEVLARASAGEAKPQTDLEQFVVTLKQITVVGYYSSEIGIHQDLEYQGNTYLNHRIQQIRFRVVKG